MPRSFSVKTVLLVSAGALLAMSLQLHPAAAVLTVTSNGAAPLPAYYAHLPPPPGGFDDDDDSDIFGDAPPRSRQTWERTWTVLSHTALLDDRDEISEVKVSIPGRVFLSFSPGQEPLAKVRFSGDSSEVLDLFEVVSTGVRGVIEIRQRQGIAATDVDGYLLVEVSLAHEQKLTTLTSLGSADVVVENNVLVAYSPSDSVAITVQGSGSVFIHDTLAFNVQQFMVSLTGSGDIELSTTQIEAKTVVSTVSGSGNIRLFVNTVHAKATSLVVAGSGDVYLNSYNFDSDSLNVLIAGSGDVSVYPTGRCSSEDVSIAGSGNAYVGSVACEKASVKIGGSGDAIVQASQSLDGGVVGSGDVKYVGRAPAKIAPKVRFFTSSKAAPKPMAKAASHNKYDEARIHDLPQREPVKLSVSFVDGVTDQTVLVPLVLLALLAACFIRHENKKHSAGREPAMRAQELQPLAPAQAGQVYV